MQSPDFDPANGIMPIRILGCGGLKEVAGKGKLAGMVGSICFNGALDFNRNDPSTLTGGSNCTITMHTPAPGRADPLIVTALRRYNGRDRGRCHYQALTDHSSPIQIHPTG